MHPTAPLKKAPRHLPGPLFIRLSIMFDSRFRKGTIRFPFSHPSLAIPDAWNPVIFYYLHDIYPINCFARAEKNGLGMVFTAQEIMKKVWGTGSRYYRLSQFYIGSCVNQGGLCSADLTYPLE
jgi:hypothetical protein